MIVEDGHYLLPILPREVADRMKDKEEWPADLKARYDGLRKQFSASKAEFTSWVRKDRDSRMNRTAKQILQLIVDCLNFDTGRCDPGHQYIADELGISLRTVERTIPRIAEAGWLEVIRRGRTTTNFYRLRVSVKKIESILSYVDSLRELRAEERDRRRMFGPQSDPTKLADHSHSDPTFVRSHDTTELADHDPTELAGKHMNRTYEGEHLNKGILSEEEGISIGDDPSFDDAANSYASARGGDDENEPLPVPRNDEEADDMVSMICEGRKVHPAMRDRLRSMLKDGVLTPRMIERMFDRLKGEEAA
ncbi:hypothetical protein [Rhizobium rosettiformans]|uniref:hypothetical protein n=1 Tax=Rhizobium rosettiformans TaxID=1368430 RepID=UPI0028672A05|nr:hypothetical protein [Rhizobium rosettiformans]MDR7027244.1 DNA-binding transcriptional ArsR family regulator [Rhizobium rosettiformans]MDR7065365.1 DNA-binding transcriptional ArsR family regulator [Rhizobium rosettiformans]